MHWHMWVVRIAGSPGGMGEAGTSAIVPAVTKRDLCGNRQAFAKAADRRHRVEAAGVKRNAVAMRKELVPSADTTPLGQPFAICLETESRSITERRKRLRLRAHGPWGVMLKGSVSSKALMHRPY
jgi:hypothetical protein